MTDVLIIDDDDLFREELTETLQELGYAVTTATNMAEGRALAKGRPLVILLDQRLRGHAGPDDGLDRIEELRQISPGSRVVLMSGFGSEEAVRTAFARGAHDYLEKGRSFRWFLPHRVRSAYESAWSDRDARVVHDKPLSEALAAAQDSKRSAQERGLQLEKALLLLFQSMEGLADAHHNVKQVGQQLDVVVFNESTDPWLQKQGSVLLIECKNWAGRVGTPEVRALLGDMGRWRQRCRLGVLVALGGYSGETRVDLLRESKGDKLVVLMDASDLEAWVDATDRVAWFVARVKQALLDEH